MLAALLATAQVQAQEIPQQTPSALTRQINRIVQQEPFQNTLWGILVQEVSGGDVLYARNAGTSMLPASNVKLFTTAAALDLLGPDYTYTTPLYAQGDVTNGTLNGNLIVRGSGDPTFSGRFENGERTAIFERWASELQSAGIQSVNGDVIGDDDFFDDMQWGEGWSWDNFPYYYSAPSGALSFNDNTIDLYVRARRVDMPASISWRPYNTDYVRVINRSRTVSASADYDEEYVKHLGTNTFVVGSLLPVGDSDHEALSVTNPTLYFTSILRQTLLRSGIAVAGAPVDVDSLSIKPEYEGPDDLRLITTYTSPSLRQIVQVTNTRSENFYAEQLLKTIGAEHPITPGDPLYDDDMEAGSSEMGAAASLETFAKAGIDTSRINLVDGSGLSRKNLVTPRMTVQLLRYMWSDAPEAVSSAFYESLPLGGVSGTLRYRFDRGPAHGNVRAKTGSLSHVSALSGYVRTRGGRMLAFSIMANNYTADGDDIDDAIDAVVSTLARYRR